MGSCFAKYGNKKFAYGNKNLLKKFYKIVLK